MNQYTERFRISFLSGSIVLGLVLMALGAIMTALTVVFPVAHALSILIFVAGMGMVGVAVAGGLSSHRRRFQGRVIAEQNCRVVTRYAYDRSQELILDDWRLDEDDVTFCVKLWSVNRGVLEYECAREVWETCGEGLCGEAVTQGHWLSGFRPHVPGQPNINLR
mgnify:CR=1 FL=1